MFPCLLARDYHLKGLLLDAKAGSGKTYTSLMWGTLNGNKKHIIISPKNVVNTVWVEHIVNKAFKVGRNCWTTISGAPFDPTAEYFVIHYDYLRREELFNTVGKIFKASGGEGVDLVIDECHNFTELNVS